VRRSAGKQACDGYSALSGRLWQKAPRARYRLRQRGRARESSTKRILAARSRHTAAPVGDRLGQTSVLRRRQHPRLRSRAIADSLNPDYCGAAKLADWASAVVLHATLIVVSPRVIGWVCPSWTDATGRRAYSAIDRPCAPSYSTVRALHVGFRPGTGTHDMQERWLKWPTSTSPY